MKISYILFIGMLTIFTLASCHSRFAKYQADWIVTEAKFKGNNVLNIITLFNFTIDVKNKSASPCDISFTNEFMLSKYVPIQFSTKGGKDYIEIREHYNLNGKYQIQCLDKNCCTISLKNDKVYLEMVYNSDIPWGISRNCK